MERKNNDPEPKYTQKSLQRTSDDNMLTENQLPMATPYGQQSSGNGTPTEDLPPTLSEDRSPTVTPNTTQDWPNEENPEITIHQDEAIHEENTIKERDLQNVTQDFMYLENVEKHTESSTSEKSDCSSVTEEQPQGTVHNFKKMGNILFTCY
jgi:hypothetical protein